MEKLVILLAALALTTGLPIDFNVEYGAYNASRAASRAVGFGGMGGGTVGGQGGTQLTVWDAWALRDGVNSNSPRIITIRARIDLTALFVNSPGVRIPVSSFTTIQGLQERAAEIIGGGLTLNGVQQVRIYNIKFANALSYAPGERPNGNGGITNQQPGPFSEIDAIDMQRSQYVWIDHCDFSSDPWNIDSLSTNQRRHDGLIDVKRASNWVTISHNQFRNHNHNSLVGHNDGNAAEDRGNLKVTYFANWFRGTRQRNPRVRYGEVHMLNNLYTDIGSYGIGVGAGASIYAERNVFINTRRAWGFPDGTPNPMGNLRADTNAFQNSQFDSGIPSSVNWNPSNYYSYRAVAIGEVETYVRRFSGII